MITFNIEQIIQRLPHRYPFLLVDRVLEITDGKRIKALKNVTINEPFFQGHFPQKPVMPGVLMLEAMAQTSALLSMIPEGEALDPDVLYYFVGIDNARFKRVVQPGDQLILEAEMVRSRAGIYSFKATASVDGQLACSADLMCAVRKAEA